MWIKNSVISVLLLLITACGTLKPADVSGTWETEGAIPYIVEHTTERPHGQPVEHESVQLLERSATLKWALKQRADGLVTGMNHWISHDESGAVFSGTEPLLGTFDGNQLVLVETNEDGPQVRFELTPVGKDRLHGVGHGSGSDQLIAMKFELFRKH